jgi:hypothetical protein
MQVREAEDAPASHARAPFQQIDAASALIAVGRELRIAEDPEFRHRWSGIDALDCASACNHRALGVSAHYTSNARAWVRGRTR